MALFEKHSPALEVVAHSRLNRRFAIAESRTSHVGLNLGVVDQLHNRTAACTSSDTAVLESQHQQNSCAPVIPCDLINLLTLRCLREDGQAKHIIPFGSRIYAELKHVNACATDFIGDIAIQLKAPPSNDRPQHVGEHPQGLGGDGDAHNVALSNEFTAQHNEIIEFEMIWVFRIIVLVHHRGNIIDLCELYQVAKCVIHFRADCLAVMPLRTL